MNATVCSEYAYEAALAVDPLYVRFRGLDVCEDLDESECMMLFACFEVKQLPSGVLLYEADASSDHSMRLILDGEVSVKRDSDNICDQLYAGDVFGLFSFLDVERPHSATLKVVADLTLLSINRAYFNVITLEDPQLGQHMLRFMFRLLTKQSLKLGNEYAAIVSGMSQQRVSDA